MREIFRQRKMDPAKCLLALDIDGTLTNSEKKVTGKSHDSSADLLCIRRLQTEHCHQITQFKVDSCKGDYL